MYKFLRCRYSYTCIIDLFLAFGLSVGIVGTELGSWKCVCYRTDTLSFRPYYEFESHG
jgi:hypothetical protein